MAGGGMARGKSISINHNGIESVAATSMASVASKISWRQ